MKTCEPFSGTRRRLRPCDRTARPCATRCCSLNSRTACPSSFRWWRCADWRSGTGGQGTNFGVLSQMTDENDFVDAACHGRPSLSAMSSPHSVDARQRRRERRMHCWFVHFCLGREIPAYTSPCRTSASAARAPTTFEEHRPRSAARPADRSHRAVGLGQVLARLRYAVCRRPAPLRRVAVRLRAAVPVDDGQAGCRLASKGSRPRSPSSRKRIRTIRAPPSARSPRSTTICGCCSRAPASRAARTTASI